MKMGKIGKYGFYLVNAGFFGVIGFAFLFGFVKVEVLSLNQVFGFCCLLFVLVFSLWFSVVVDKE